MFGFGLVMLPTISVFIFNGLFLQVLSMSIKGQFREKEADGVILKLNRSSPLNSFSGRLEKIGGHKRLHKNVKHLKGKYESI